MAMRHKYIPGDLIYGCNQSLSESVSCSASVQPPAHHIQTSVQFLEILKQPFMGNHANKPEPKTLEKTREKVITSENISTLAYVSII